MEEKEEEKEKEQENKIHNNRGNKRGKYNCLKVQGSFYEGQKHVRDELHFSLSCLHLGCCEGEAARREELRGRIGEGV